MSFWRLNRGELRRIKNRPQWFRDLMFEVDHFIDEKIRWPWRYVTRVFWERLGRALRYFTIGWLNHDFDAIFMHELLLFKLKRMQYCFIHYGYHSEDCENYKPKMKSLALAIKLLERYCKNDYNRWSDMHERKWGPLTHKSIKVEGSENKVYGPHYRMEFSRPNAITEQEKEQERKESMEAYNKDDKESERDIRIVYQIVSKYHRYWWD